MRRALALSLTLLASVSFAEPGITTNVVDRIEYVGLTKDFCTLVGREAEAAKGRKVAVFAFMDTMTDALDRNPGLRDPQKAVAKRVVTLITSRVYVVKKMTTPEVDALSGVECTWANLLLQGNTALNSK